MACRVVSINRGPWSRQDGSRRGSNRCSKAGGHSPDPDRRGAHTWSRSFESATARPVKVVILGEGGRGLDFLKPEGHLSSDEEGRRPGLAKVFERPLDVESTPIHGSHVMDGRPVLPMALILERAGEAMARDWSMACLGVDDLRAALKGGGPPQGPCPGLHPVPSPARGSRRDRPRSIVPVRTCGEVPGRRPRGPPREGRGRPGRPLPRGPAALRRAELAPFGDDPPRDLPRRAVPRPRPPGERRRGGVWGWRDRRDGLGRAQPVGVGRQPAPQQIG